MKRVLMVIDMLNGFLEKRHNLYCGPQGRAIIPFVREKVKEYKESGDPVIFLCDSHDPDDKEFEIFGRHCVTGTHEAEIIEELRPLAEGAICLPKKKYFDFFTPELVETLWRLAPEVVELVGVCTNICIFFATEELRKRDYKVRVYERGVASFDEQAHRFALDQMKNVLAVEVVSAEPNGSLKDERQGRKASAAGRV